LLTSFLHLFSVNPAACLQEGGRITECPPGRGPQGIVKLRQII